MNKILKVILIGAGNRGDTYTDIMDKMTDKFKVVAVAEPIESRNKDICCLIICALKIGNHYWNLEKLQILL